VRASERWPRKSTNDICRTYLSPLYFTRGCSQEFTTLPSAFFSYLSTHGLFLPPSPLISHSSLFLSLFVSSCSIPLTPDYLSRSVLCFRTCFNSGLVPSFFLNLFLSCAPLLLSASFCTSSTSLVATCLQQRDGYLVINVDVSLGIIVSSLLFLLISVTARNSD